VSKIEDLEGKFTKIAELIASLRKENKTLRQEAESLKSHLSLLNGENSKAQQILADYEQLRRKQELVTQKVERALSTLNGLRSSP
jgi:uncharacterized protein involved in exopolysaccharide biosynthesis